MLETIYNFTLIFSWMIVVFHSFFLFWYFLSKKTVPYNNILYTLLIAVAWIIANK